MAYYNFVHSIGLHTWDLPALIVLILIIIIGLVHSRNQKKREKDFAEEERRVILGLDDDSKESGVSAGEGMLGASTDGGMHTV